MLFTIIVLVVLVAAALIMKASKSKPQDECCAHQPVEEISVPAMVEEPQAEVETVPTVEVVPTTPPSAPVMAAKKKKKPQPKKKPTKANA